MTPLTQTKVLRVLQEQRFERVGGNETIQTDVRIIAATNRDLDKFVAAGQFRSDLYYRLSVFTITLPPLRERLEDLPLLVEHFVWQFGRELEKNIRQIAPETLEQLRQHRWPGNIRELQSVLKQALLRAKGAVLLPDFLPVLPAGAADDKGAPSPFPAWDRFIDDRLQAHSEHLYAEMLEAMERQLITRVLRHTAGNQLQAAKILGITRGSLRNKIHALGILIERAVWSENDPE